MSQSLLSRLHLVVTAAKADNAATYNVAVRIGEAAAEFAESTRTDLKLIDGALDELRDDFEGAEAEIHEELSVIRQQLADLSGEVDAGFMRVGASVGAELGRMRVDNSNELSDLAYAISDESALRRRLGDREASTADRVRELERKIETLMTPWHERAWRKLVARF